MAIVTEKRVPPLRAGDQLTREEFLRRWESHPRIKLAELIRGDSNGLAFWLKQFADGQTNEDVIAGFTGSAEYDDQHTSG